MAADRSINAVTEYMYGKTVQVLNESESAALLKELKKVAQSYLEQYNILEPKIKEYNKYISIILVGKGKGRASHYILNPARKN